MMRGKYDRVAADAIDDLRLAEKTALNAQPALGLFFCRRGGANPPAPSAGFLVAAATAMVRSFEGFRSHARRGTWRTRRFCNALDCSFQQSTTGTTTPSAAPSRKEI